MERHKFALDLLRRFNNSAVLESHICMQTGIPWIFGLKVFVFLGGGGAHWFLNVEFEYLYPCLGCSPLLCSPSWYYFLLCSVLPTGAMYFTGLALEPLFAASAAHL